MQNSSIDIREKTLGHIPSVLVTGASGFVGRALCAYLSEHGHVVRAALRRGDVELGTKVSHVIVGELNSQTDWSAALANVDVVIHLAARVHVMKETSADPLDAFRETNFHGTERLAREAAASGVRRLVFVSSIKVIGESTFPDASNTKQVLPNPSLSPIGCKNLCEVEWGIKKSVFIESAEANPQDPYGISKWEAEQALHHVAQETGLEVVILRPPLVYGAGVKGNFAQMLRVLVTGIPLPFASVTNLRSLIYLENFTDALRMCATHPSAAGQTYLVSDGEDISTPDMLRQLGAAMGHPAHLLPCPPVLLKLAGRLLGKSAQVDRLLGSLQVDSSKIRRELNWLPPYTLQQGLHATASSYRNLYQEVHK